MWELRGYPPWLGFLIKAVVWAVALRLFFGYVYSVTGFFSFLLIPTGFLLWAWYRSIMEEEPVWRSLLSNLTLIPVPTINKGKERFTSSPWCTYGLILFMGFVFFSLQGKLDPKQWGRYTFFPTNPHEGNALVASVTHIFMHGSDAHYLGNMFFLWVIGTVLERRIGWRKTLTAFLLTGIAAGHLSVLTYLVGTGRVVHSLGASGAISGLMGLFAVRCYFKTMNFPIPLLGIFSLLVPLQVKLRVNSLAVIAFFFSRDLLMGTKEVVDLVGPIDINHWAHVWGMVAGVGLALRWKVLEEAEDEREREILTEVSGRWTGTGEGLKAAENLLRRKGDDPEVFLHMARIRTRFGRTEEGERAYGKAVELFLRTDPEMAVRTFREFLREYTRPRMAPEHLYRLAQLLFQRGDPDTASRCLEMILEQDEGLPGSMRAKVLYHLGRLLREMGFEEAANARWEELVDGWPDSPWALQAAKRLRGEVKPHEPKGIPNARTYPFLLKAKMGKNRRDGR